MFNCRLANRLESIFWAVLNTGGYFSRTKKSGILNMKSGILNIGGGFGGAFSTFKKFLNVEDIYLASMD